MLQLKMRERERGRGGERDQTVFFAACVICFMREQLLLPDNHDCVRAAVN